MERQPRGPYPFSKHSTHFDVPVAWLVARWVLGVCMTGRLLVCYSGASNYVPTTAEYLASFARHSRWDVRYLHVTHGAELAVDLGEFDAVLQSYCARLPVDGGASDAFCRAMAGYTGVLLIRSYSGAATGSVGIKAQFQTAASTSSADFSSVGTALATTTTTGIVFYDVENPGKRYCRVVESCTLGNSGGWIAIQYGARTLPTTHDASVTASVSTYNTT